MKKYKIVAIAQINNELRKGNLERFFQYLPSNVDEIVIYDDASTDGSWEYAEKFTPHVIRGTKNNFANEWQIKQELVAKALTLKPDFILLIDADEVLTDTKGSKMQALADWVTERDLDGAFVQELNLWRSRNNRRTDSDFGNVWFSRFWRVRDTLTYTNRTSGLHQSPAPDQIKSLEKQDILAFLHFGFENDKAIAWKYIAYAQRGQRGEDLARFVTEEKFLTTSPVAEELYPPGLWQDDNAPSARSVAEWYDVFNTYRDEITKPNISIVCLIYQSTSWLQFVYNQVLAHTDLSDKEFFFVANDANDDVKQYLHNHYIPHYIFDNSPEQRTEWYINNVYRAWNYGARMARGDLIIFINSDMAFSPNWVENLLAAYTGKNCVASRLVESGNRPTGGLLIEKNFGRHCTEYKEDDFIAFVDSTRIEEIHEGGPYMPLLIKKSDFESVNGYPEGNMREGADVWHPLIAEKGEAHVTGDRVLMQKLASRGILHETTFNSIVYHFQEGEMRDIPSTSTSSEDVEVVIVNNNLRGIVGEKTFWNFLLEQLPRVAGVDMPTTGSSERTFTTHAAHAITTRYPNARFVIQNATFIDTIRPDLHTFALLQDDLRRMGRMSLQQEETLSQAHTLVANSCYTAGSYPEYLFNIIPLGLDETLFAPGDKDTLRAAYSIPRHKKVGIFVGSLTPVKGWERVHATIHTHPEIHWIVVSKNKDEYAAENVSLFTQVSQTKLADLYRCADFFIIGSPVETQCLAALEACLSGLPVIMRLTGAFVDFTEKEREQCGIFGDDFELALTQISARTFTPRETILRKGFTVEAMVTRWWNLIAHTKLTARTTAPPPLPHYSWKTTLRRRMRMFFSKTFIIVLAKRHLSPRAFAHLLEFWRYSKKVLNFFK